MNYMPCVVCYNNVEGVESLLCDECHELFSEEAKQIREITQGIPTDSSIKETTAIVNELKSKYKNLRLCELCNTKKEIVDFKYNLLLCQECSDTGDFSKQIDAGIERNITNPKSTWG